MKLTREQRRAFFDGDWPRLSGEGDCPVEPGYVCELSSRLSFEVIRIRTPRRGGWSLEYRVVDSRNDPFLRAGNHTVPVDDEGNPAPMTFDEEHGYTSNPRSGMDAGRSVPRTYQDTLSKNSNEAWKGYLSVVRSDEIREQEMRALFNKVRRIQGEAMKKGADLRPILVDFIDKAQREVRN